MSFSSFDQIHKLLNIMADIKKEAKYQSGSSPTGEDDFFSKNTVLSQAPPIFKQCMWNLAQIHSNTFYQISK